MAMRFRFPRRCGLLQPSSHGLARGGGTAAVRGLNGGGNEDLGGRGCGRGGRRRCGEEAIAAEEALDVGGLASPGVAWKSHVRSGWSVVEPRCGGRLGVRPVLDYGSVHIRNEAFHICLSRV
ncbi:hypothetical protein ACLOJK_030106 [Asimina triloba]